LPKRLVDEGKINSRPDETSLTRRRRDCAVWPLSSVIPLPSASKRALEIGGRRSKPRILMIDLAPSSKSNDRLERRRTKLDRPTRFVFARRAKRRGRFRCVIGA